MLKRFLTLALVTVLGFTGALIGGGTGRAAGPIAGPPAKYYLAMGDSVTFGYQQGKVAAIAKASGTVDPSLINTGFTDNFYKMLWAVDPGIQMVNLGCPGATSTDMVSTPGCKSYPFPLHSGYTTSQLQAAAAFLQAHPGQVSPITVNAGPNDVLQLVASCGGLGNIACVAAGLPAVLGLLAKNLGTMLGTLRAAAPGAEIIVLTTYNPYSAADPSTNALAVGFNQVISQVAAATGAYVADIFTPINLAQPQPQTLCALLLICTALQDIHPSDAGYLVIAKAVWDVSGYNGLGGGFMVTFNSVRSGNGVVYFGTSSGCTGLVSVSTHDLIQSQGSQHIVFVTGNDMPGTSGDDGITPGVAYYYETVVWGSFGMEIDNNGGKCYTAAIQRR
jgi:lysophospholipase L1-like esterase